MQTFPDSIKYKYRGVQIPDLKVSSDVKIYALDHGKMSKVIILNDFKLYTINVYDTGFITPEPFKMNMSNPVYKSDHISTEP